MSIRDIYNKAKQQQSEAEARKQQEAFFRHTPRGMIVRIDQGLAEIAAKVENDVQARIQALQGGQRKDGPITYRIEQISHLSEPMMKSILRLEGYKALQDTCSRPDIDVRVNVVAHHGCLNGGVDIRVYPDQPFKGSGLSMDGMRVRALPKRVRLAAAAASNGIPVLKPIILMRKDA